MKTYAKVAWTASDLDELTPSNWSDDQKEEWLANNASRIQQRLCELGHQVIEDLLQLDGVQGD